MFFKDTFRRERSLSYQSALRRAMKEREDRLRAHKEKARKRHSRDEKHDHDARSMSPDLEVQPEHPQPTLADIRLTLRDINPIRPVGSVLRRLNNVAILSSSGESFCAVSVWWSSPIENNQDCCLDFRTVSHTQLCARLLRRLTSTTHSTSGLSCFLSELV